MIGGEPEGVIQSVIFRTIAGMARSYHGNVIYIDRVGAGYARDSIRAPTGKITLDHTRSRQGNRMKVFSV
ncbi:MAG: hypothetical protein BECKG1743F_GA0114225_106764 [Candidatus Kentron sp. G]|nr:MAG: hypothetical protein BECKG1743F_GA0114225_106764 [Candidatus Kentron sp. G]VFN07736.1 MAG: hypothetical protein BECKG1743E_GA0114224_112842 [Candidatus Kentron sp. G]